eukprot:CAMPEP_0197549738 /NCGR_PEP_ID=MMETSP1320-20131121/3558_1 /TAXON_ID=91990 /ORGANISM="Bolidomonas sp., Strain RCC2347" /LENGTH=194 /DNA_ID=CAMNT_0043110009 /DNA_START=50 /DNA_END=634 /DNA_ORIENTATION=-
MRLLLPLLISALSSVSAAPELTLSNFESTVSSKNTLVKFFQSWCGHCKAMKPDYDKLGEMYKDDANVAVVDVDCGKETELCEANDVRGYPTLKYWKDGEENDYKLGRDFESLEYFVESTLVRPCLLSDKSNTCDDRSLAYIAKMEAKGGEAVGKEVKRLEGMLEKGAMKAELRAWAKDRVAILKQMDEGGLGEL